MHLVSSSKLKALFLLPILLILFSFGEGDKEVPKFPLAENSLTSADFALEDDGIEPLIPDIENTFYIDGKVIDPKVEVRCEDDEFAPSYTCGDITSTKSNFIPAFGKCAPRDLLWIVKFRFPVEDAASLPGDYKVRFFPDLVNAPGFFINSNATWDDSGVTDPGGYQATINYTYPTNGVVCTFTAAATLRITGEGSCGGSGILTEVIVVWDDLSNTNTGTHDVDHDGSSAGVEVGETVELCAGDDNPVRLEDTSTFNCTPAFEPTPDNENRQSRWVQWEYGTFSNITTGAAANEKIIINGVSYTNADLPIYGTPTQQVGADFPAVGVTAPNAITDDIQMPVSALVTERFEVTIRSWNTCNAYSINNDMAPPQANPDDVFQINGSGPVGTEQAGLNLITGGGVYYANDNPITRTFDIIIAPKPPIPVAGSKDYCYGTNLTLAGNPGFEITPGAVSVATEWYEDNAGVVDFGSPIVNSNGANSNELEAADYTGVGGPGITGTDVGTYFVWGRYSSNTGTQNCWSDPIQIQMDVREQLVTPASVSSTGGAFGFTICADGPNIIFTVDDGPPASGTPGGAWEYNWRFDPAGTLDDDLSFTTANGLQSRTVDITNNAAIGLRRVQVRRRYATNDDNGIRCATNYKNFDFNIDPVSVGGTLTATNNDICLGSQTGNIGLGSETGNIIAWFVNINAGGFNLDAGLVGDPINPTPAVIGTHEYRATVKSGVCGSTFSSTVTVNVNPVPPKPTIGTSGSTICEDGSIVTLTSSTINAASYQWYKGGVAIGGEVNQTIVLNTVAESGNYTVEVIGIVPTLCTSIISDAEAVIINPLPTATVVGGGSVCSGLPAPDIVWTLTGAQPYDFTITVTPGANIVVAGHNAATYTIVGPNPGVDTDYEMTILSDNNSCNSIAMGGVAQVTIGGVAANVDDFAVDAEICEDEIPGPPGVPTWHLDLDAAGSYDIDYTIDGAAQPQLVNVASTAAGVISHTVDYAAQLGSSPGTYTIAITGIVNVVTGCTGNLPLGTDDIVINPQPADATNPVHATSCITGVGVALNVDAPPVGTIIHWYQDVLLTTDAAPAFGVVSGLRNKTFTPTASTTATFYAVVESTTAPTNCQSANSVSVVQTEDQQPSAANAEDATAVGVPPAVVGTCDDTFTFNATPADNGGTGIWTTTDGGVTFAPNANAPNAVASNIPIGTLTFTWTVTSGLGVCATSFDNYDVTRHNLPVANSFTADFCEDTYLNNNYDVTAGDLTGFDDTVTGIVGSANRIVTYFTDLALSIPVATPYSVADNDQIYAKVVRTDVTPNCESSSIILFNIITLPEGVDQDAANNAAETEFCEETVSSTDKDNIDLTTLDDNVIGGGAPGDRTVVWYLDPGPPVTDPSDLVALVGTPTDVDNVADGTLFYALITDTSTPNNCENFAQVEITVLPRPLDNPIQAPDLSTPATITLCKSGANQLFQINPLLNAGSTYSWTVPQAVGEFVVVGPTNLQFVVIQAPNAIAGPGLPITLVETLPNGCPGNTNTINIIVEDAPAAPLIVGAADVCDGDNGVIYNIFAPIGGNTYAWDINGLGTIVLGQGTSSITVNIGNTSDVITVVETSAAGCAGPPAVPFAVTVNPLPNMTSAPAVTICSGTLVSTALTFTDDIGGGTTFAWEVNSKAGSVGGALVGDIGAGDINQTLTNTSGAIGAVVYEVTPTSAVPGLCDGSIQLVTITVDPEPVIPAAQTKTICSGDQVDLEIMLTPGNSPVGTVFDWPAPTMSDASVQGSAGVGVAADPVGTLHLTDALVNTTGAAITATYNITPTGPAATNCLGISQNVVITVDSQPLGTMDALTTCSSSPLNYNLVANVVAGNGMASTFTYVVASSDGVNVPPAADRGVASNLNITDTYTNTTAVDVDITYTITPIETVSGNSCTGNNFDVVFTIESEPLGGADAVTTCSDAALNYDLQVTNINGLGNGMASTFMYVVASSDGVNVPPAADRGVASNLNITDTYTNTTAVDVDITYTITPIETVSGNSCTGNNFDVVFTIESEPLGVNDANVAHNKCSGDALSYDIQALNINGFGNGLLSTFTYTVTSTDGAYVPGTNDRGVKSTAAITDTYTNITGVDVTVQYTITPFDFVTACEGNIFTVDFIIYSEPVGGADAVISCSDDALNYNIQTANINLGNSVVSDFTFTVSSDNVLVNPEPNRTIPSNAIINYTYTNTSAVDANITYTITPISQANSCQGSPFDVVFTIQVEPNGADFSATECGGITLDHDLNTDITNGIDSKFYYTVSSNNGGVPAGPNRLIGVASDLHITDSYNNATATDAVITYVVTPIDKATNCEGDAFNVVFTIQPGPEGIADLEEECSSVALNYDIQADNISNGGNGVAGKFSYTVVSANQVDVPAEADRVVASTLPITHTYVNTTAAPPVDVTYTITPEGFGAGCTGTPFDVIFRINPEPVINPFSSTICSRDNLTIAPTLANFAVGDVNFTWTITNISGTITGNFSGLIVGDDNVTNPFPHVTENVSSAPAIITYTYTATSTILNNCASATEDILITVNPEPVGTSTTIADVCSDEAFSINPDAFISNLAGNTFTWTGAFGALIGGTPAGVGTINETLTNTTNATINAIYTITPSSSGGTCAGLAFDITVPVKPEPVLDPALSPAPVCSGVASGINLGVAVGSVAADNYDINQITIDPGLIPGGGNASIGLAQPFNVLASDVFTNTTNGQLLVTYKVRPVTATCKGDEVDVIFTINPAPEIDPNLDNVVCSNDVSGILFIPLITSAPVADYDLVAVTKDLALTTVLISVPAGGVAANYIMADQFINPTNNPLTVVYEVLPNSTAFPSCAGPSEFITLTVEPDITATPDNRKPIICSNDLTEIELISPTNPTAGNVTFNVTVLVTTGVASGFIPALNFLPENYIITDNLVNTGNIDAVVEYTITPTASAAANNGGCTGASSVVNVTVEPLPQVSPGQFIQVCSDIALNYEILNANGLVGTKFKWPAPVVTGGLTGGTARAVASTAFITDAFNNPTALRQTATYTVTPVGPSANNCEGIPISVIIFVDPTPAGTISVDQPVVCSGGFALLSFAMTVGTAPFEIVYDDGSGPITVSNIANSHFISLINLTATTTYTFVSITDVYGCVLNPVGDQVTITVEDPIAAFTMVNSDDCTPLEVIFSNNNIQAGTVYSWNFGDGSPIETTNAASVSHTYINNSTVSDISFVPILTATITNGTVVCTELMQDIVTVRASVALNVAPSATNGCAPLNVNFDNLSQGVLVHKWFWREQGTAVENEVQTSPTVSYTLPNTTTSNIVYEVVYQGTRNTCSDEFVTEITVYPEVNADFTVAPGTTVSITDPTITVTNTTVNKNSWITLWEWGDGETTTNVDPGSHTYALFGTYELKLTVRDPGGICESIKTEIITVEPVLPEVDFEVDINQGCMPLTVQFTNLSQYVDPATYVWTFVDETGATIGTSTAESPEFTFFLPGIINVTLAGSNPLGVTDTETKLGYIEIYELPTASLSVRPDVVFLPDQIMFTSNLSRLADEFSWDFDGDGIEDSNEFEPSFKYNDPGVYDVSLIAKNTDTGCSDTVIVEKAVTVVESGSSDVPNGFFPGSGLGDEGAGGSNTVFLPRIKGVRDDGFMMQIFDRWGHLLFESNNKSEGWNGRHFNSGKLMASGVYVYKLELVYISGEQTTIVGDVNLIR